MRSIVIESERCLGNLPQFVGAKCFVVVTGTTGSGTPWAWYENEYQTAGEAISAVTSFIDDEEEYRLMNPHSRYAWRVVVMF